MEDLYRPGLGAASSPSPHVLSTVSSPQSHAQPQGSSKMEAACAPRKESMWDAWKRLVRGATPAFPVSKLRGLCREGWDYTNTSIFVSFPSRSGKLSLKKKKKKKDDEKKMTHNAQKDNTCSEKNNALGVIRGFGSHPGPTRETMSFPHHTSSPSLRE